MILVTRFEALARERHPWAPVGVPPRRRMEVADAPAAASAPGALIAAERDAAVPPRRTEPLRGAAGDLAMDRVITGAGHNDLYDRTEFTRAMREALSRVEARSRRAGSERPK